MSVEAAPVVADATPAAAAPDANAPPSLLADDKPASSDTPPTPAAGDKPAADVAPPAKAESLLSDDDDGKPPAKSDAPGDETKDETPAEYQAFTLPDGMTLDENALAKAMPVFKELKLDQASAQKLVSVYAEQMAATREAFIAEQLEVQNQTVEEWRKAVVADPEIGGENLAKNLGIAKRAWKTLASPAMRELFDTWGLSNHPEVIRFCFHAGSKLSEGTFVPSNSAPQTKAQTLAAALYE